jgi:hypothetical protein
VGIVVSEQDSDKILVSAKGASNNPFTFQVDSPDLWTPDTPTLYNIEITLGEDCIHSYTGFRTISRGVVDGVQRVLLNGEFYAFFSPLDQGFWPDGIYTPPTVEAMRYDLEQLKEVGFNAVRKHIKVEPALYYKAADELGFLVIQDMPSMRPDLPDPNGGCGSIRLEGPEAQQEFNRQLGLMVQQLRSYTSIFAWTIYNEEWGQSTDDSKPWPEFELTDLVRSLDPTRLVNAVSGWTDHTAGDFDDNHHYSTPQCGSPFYSVLLVTTLPTTHLALASRANLVALGHSSSKGSMLGSLIQACKQPTSSPTPLRCGTTGVSRISNSFASRLSDLLALEVSGHRLLTLRERSTVC